MLLGKACETAEISNNSEDLFVLAKHEDWEVRYRVARNCNTTVKTLIELSEDDSMAVRCGVATHPKTPFKVLTKLASDPICWVRMALLENRNLPIDILTKLSTDRNIDVLEHAKKELQRRIRG